MLPEKPTLTDTVLVADDDPIFRHVLQSCLEKWNYRNRLEISISIGAATVQAQDSVELLLARAGISGKGSARGAASGTEA